MVLKVSKYEAMELWRTLVVLQLVRYPAFKFIGSRPPFSIVPRSRTYQQLKEDYLFGKYEVGTQYSLVGHSMVPLT